MVGLIPPHPTPEEAAHLAKLAGGDRAELLPCPFCGTIPQRPDGPFVVCRECECEGPFAYLASEPDPCGKAVELWNTRAAHLRRADDGWRDMATAPRDGSEILTLFFEDPPGNGPVYQIAEADEDSITLDDGRCVLSRAAARYMVWRPLPAPPTPTDGGTDA